MVSKLLTRNCCPNHIGLEEFIIYKAVINNIQLCLLLSVLWIVLKTLEMENLEEILLLPSTSFYFLHHSSFLFQMLLQFLSKVVSAQENKMTLQNVSMIMAPNLFLTPNTARKSKLLGILSSSDKPVQLSDIELNMATGTANVVRMLIKYQHIFYTVSDFFLQITG